MLHIEIQGSSYILLNYYDPNNELNQVKVLRLISVNYRQLILMITYNLFHQEIVILFLINFLMLWEVLHH